MRFQVKYKHPSGAWRVIVDRRTATAARESVETFTPMRVRHDGKVKACDVRAWDSVAGEWLDRQVEAFDG